MNDALAPFGGNPWVGGGAPETIKKDDQMLCDACRTGNYEKAKQALESGANSSVQFRLALGEITPIFLCASKGYLKIAKLLIEHNADISKKMDFDGTICLHHAASNDQKEMCNFLITQGCFVDEKDKLGRTPLMDAAEIGSVGVIKTLVDKHNADVNIEDKEHHSALSYCIDFISTKEPKFFEAAEVLVGYRADPNFGGKFASRMILHCASAQGKLELCKKLVDEYGANVRVIDNENKSPIDYARENNHQDVEEYLMSAASNQEGCKCTIM